MQSAEIHEHSPGSQGGVVFLLNSLVIGGSERKAVSIVNTLHARGWNVHLFRELPLLEKSIIRREGSRPLRVNLPADSNL